MRRPVHVPQRVRERVARLELDGADLADLDRAIDALKDRKSLERFRAHDLTGQLEGWQACDVGTIADGRTAVAVYYTNQDADYAGIAAIDEHDAAYIEAQRLRAEQAGKPSRRKAKVAKIKPAE